MAVFSEFRNFVVILAAILTAGVVVAAIIIFVVGRFGKALYKSRGVRVVNCPETGQPVAVELKAAHAARTALFGRPDLELKSCTRWPEKGDCGQMCIRQIEWAPDGCMLKSRLAEFYIGKKCVFCEKEIHAKEWLERKPGLKLEDGKIAAWDEIPAEQVPATLLMAQPVCFSCSITERFRAEHPDLVIDRKR